MRKILISASALFVLLLFANGLKAQNLEIYSYWNSSIGKHFYTTFYSELGSGKNGFVQTSQTPSLGFLLPINGPDGPRTVYRFFQPSSGAHYYTQNKNVFPDGFHLEGSIGCSAGTPLAYIVPVYEFYNSGDYYYSTSSTVPAGYKLNGIAFYTTGS